MVLLGGLLFAALAWLPALQKRGGAEMQEISDAIAARFRPWVLLAIGGLLASGFYNYLRHATAKDVPTMYHMIFGMKFLLALHVFAIGLLAMTKGNTRRARLIAGGVISGLVILALSGWMRYLALSMLAPIGK